MCYSALARGGGLCCIHTSQVADHSKSQSPSHSGPNSGLSLLTVSPPTSLADALRWYCLISITSPAALLPSPPHIFRCLSVFLPPSHTGAHTLSPSFSLLCALAVLSRGLVSGSACYSPPALIKEENWNPFNQTARSPALPPPLQLSTPPPFHPGLQSTHGCGGWAARRWTSHS